ncbi:maestro heat-like repeat-containing protein family member 6 [Grus japonensis]|uniref:Maestro heat-like repeat-containing protein family member 6 n=1 Tax=Grus japonensis TaxID=30415 RepID=A0ABC9XA91_GRUJA
MQMKPSFVAENQCRPPTRGKERIPPASPREAWEEERAVPNPSSRLKPDQTCQIQPLQADPCHSTLAVTREEENALKVIQAFLRTRPKEEAQKLNFLASICTICNTTITESAVWDVLYFCQLEVVEAIKVLLQEEPTALLGTTVRQQAMLAITSMSRAGLLLQETTNLLQVCFCSTFYLPPQEEPQGPKTSLYSKTLDAMDSMLQALVHSADTLGILELQNILQLLLPFTSSHLAAVQERAVARVARLADFITTYPLPQICPCFAQDVILRHQCSKIHRFTMMGKLVGQLILCCTCRDKGTRQEAAEALQNLHTFILQQRRRWPWLHDSVQQQLQESSQARQIWQFLQTRQASKIFLMFTKYLQPSDRVDIILVAIKSLRDPRAYSIKVAAHMVDILVADFVFQPGQVLNIMWAIYRNFPSIRLVAALNSLHKALLLLMDKSTSEVVSSLLQCSPMCSEYGARQPLGLLSHWESGPKTLLRDFSLAILRGVPADRALGPRSVAMAIWKVIFSEPPVAKKALQELVSMLMKQSLRKTSISTKDNPRILSLAGRGDISVDGCLLQAARTISEILLQSICLKQVVEEIFPQLFLALLFQVSFTTELMLQEVHVFWSKHQQDLITPIRSAVQSMRMLLCRMGFESHVLAIEAQGGWDALLSTQTHLNGVVTVAREMMKTPRSLRSAIFCYLAELLIVEDPTWEMIAMAFLVEMLGCTDLNEELDRVLEIFPTYLQSQCLGMPSLALRGILTLIKKPDMAKKTLVLLPYVMEQLQGADDATAAALPVLCEMLQLLERKTASLTALPLAGKLRPLFSNELDTIREFSIRLFQNTMELVVGAEKKMMNKEVWDSLLPLLLHLHDQNKSVAKASQEALRSAGRFLKWEQLAQLDGIEQGWRISERLLARKKSKVKDYLHQCQPYLHSPQEILRREAVRFIVLQSAKTDVSPLVSSLATQTVLLLRQERPKSRFKRALLNLQLPSAWMRWRSAPSEDSARTEMEQQP